MVASVLLFFFFQAEDGIRDLVRSRGLGDVYKRQVSTQSTGNRNSTMSASEVNQAYSKKAAGYDTFRSPAPGIEEIVACLEDLPAGLDVLDLGCGTGAFFEHLYNLNPVSMLATDVNEAMVEKAKAKAQALTGSSDWVITSFTDHIAAASFDFIFCGQVVQNLTSDPSKAVEAREGFYNEIKRLLRPGGKLVLTTRNVPEGGRWSDLYWYADPEVVPEAVKNMECMVPENPVSELERVGFTDVKRAHSVCKMIRSDAYLEPDNVSNPAFRAADSFFQHVDLKEELPQLLENIEKLRAEGTLEELSLIHI
eukprot:TRINITY_DN12299_c0_g1_i2.p1 TRINITY_DN12299_c0_g1~~TRINITY_DN12299_c0_g1_i2.p1  ORF type:complete len:309 (+),score=75.64 TRINITY_DN12299_c0_g1_i2:21-947(+)